MSMVRATKRIGSTFISRVKIKGKIWPRKNHGVRYAATVYFAARYFHNSYRMPEMDRWLADVRQYFKCQMTSWMPAEGTESMAHISLMTTLMFVLAENDRDFPIVTP